MKIGDKRSAEKVAAAVRRKLAKGQFEIEPKKKTPTFGEYSKKWLLGYVQTNLRQSTYEEYFGILKNHVLPAFKSKRIDSINRGDVRDFPLSKHVDGLSQKRVMLFKDVMSGVLGNAFDEELIDVNPTAGITKRLFPKVGTKKKVIQKEEIFTR